MSFLAPGRLWLLALPLVLAVAYVVAQRARRRYALRFTNLDLLASVAPRRPGWRRHLSALLMLASIVLLTVGFARPTAERRVPREQGTVMLVLDVSTSMSAADVSPSRIVAAQQAAKDFVRGLPGSLRVGLVSFAATAHVEVAVTEDKAAVVAGIDRLTLAPSTAIGEAIFTALSAVGPVTAPDGSKSPAHIVLMSDGTTTSGRPNEAGAAAAVEAGVPVTTIAYGTDEGTVEIDGRTIPVPVDREALRAVADQTRGRFFEAADGDELRAVYGDIGRAVGYDVERQEVTALFVGFALVGATLAAAASMLWAGRLP